MNQPSNRFGVAAYGFACSCGFVRRDGQPAIAQPMDAWALIDLAARHGLSSVEIPLGGMLADRQPDTIDRLRATLAGHSLDLVVDTGVVAVEPLREILPLAARAGARVVRATISPILEGARASVPGGWDAHLAEIRRRIVELRPLLEQHDLRLALENHQDAIAAELLDLCEAGGERVGVAFDVVNPLAVGEEPFAFARAVGPRILAVHLKDYQIVASDSGFRLVRCALGDGVIDWPAMLGLLREIAPQAPQQIELAALYARNIRVLEDDWWAGFPPRDVRAALPALRLLLRHARPEQGGWQTPWELGEPGERVAAWELEQFERSVAYLRTIGAGA